MDLFLFFKLKNQVNVFYISFVQSPVNDQTRSLRLRENRNEFFIEAINWYDTHVSVIAIDHESKIHRFFNAQ